MKRSKKAAEHRKPESTGRRGQSLKTVLEEKSESFDIKRQTGASVPRSRENRLLGQVEA